MKLISIKELESHLDYYLSLSSEEDILITKDEEVISVMTNPKSKALDNFLSLRGAFGTLPENVDYKDIVTDELMEKMSKQKGAR